MERAIILEFHSQGRVVYAIASMCGYRFYTVEDDGATMTGIPVEIANGFLSVYLFFTRSIVIYSDENETHAHTRTLVYYTRRVVENIHGSLLGKY